MFPLHAQLLHRDFNIRGGVLESLLRIVWGSIPSYKSYLGSLSPHFRVTMIFSSNSLDPSAKVMPLAETKSFTIRQLDGWGFPKVGYSIDTPSYIPP